MKLIIVFLLFFFSSILFSQGNDHSIPSKKFKYTVWGGINFETISEIGGTFNFGINLEVLKNTDIRLLFGYSRIYEEFNYNVKTNSTGTIDNQIIYLATSYDVFKKGYDVFPISFGIQYSIINQAFFPFLSIDVSYNVISTDIIKSNISTWSHNTFNDIPDEFKMVNTQDKPKNSFGVAVGLGTGYEILDRIDLIFNYCYKTDSEVNNTHGISIGLLF
jgi:opacity protein-like surface antigen